MRDSSPVFAAKYSLLPPHTRLRLAQVFSAHGDVSSTSSLVPCWQRDLAALMKQPGQGDTQLVAWLAWACARAGSPLPEPVALAHLQRLIEASGVAAALAASRAESGKRARHNMAALPSPGGAAGLSAALQEGAVAAAALAQGLACHPAGAHDASSPDILASPTNTAVTALARAASAAAAACRDPVLLRQSVEAWSALCSAGLPNADSEAGVEAPHFSLSPAIDGVFLCSLLTLDTRHECLQAAHSATDRMRQLSALRQGTRARQDYTHVLF